MFKRAGESQHFIPRKGSFSTRGSRGGRVDTLPPEAQPHEQAFLELRRQYEGLERQRREIHADRERLFAERRNPATSAARSKEIRGELQQLEGKHHANKSERSHLRRTLKYAGLLPFAIVFYYVAERRLSDDLFKELDRETRELMGRRADRPAFHSDIPGRRR